MWENRISGQCPRGTRTVWLRVCGMGPFVGVTATARTFSSHVCMGYGIGISRNRRVEGVDGGGLELDAGFALSEGLWYLLL